MIIQGLLASYKTATANIAFGAVAGTSGAGTTLSWSHTCTGSNRFLLVHISTTNISNQLSSITYAGTAMTLLTTIINPSTSGYFFVYYLANPASGTNTVSATFISGTTRQGQSTSYTGVHQTTPIDSSTTNTGSGVTTLTTTTTVVGSNCWLLGAYGSNTATTLSAGTGLTSRGTQNFQLIGDSNGTVGTGSQSMTCNFSTSQNVNGVMLSLLPA